MLFNMTIAFLVVKIDDPSFQHYIFSKPPLIRGKKIPDPPPPQFLLHPPFLYLMTGPLRVLYNWPLNTQ